MKYTVDYTSKFKRDLKRLIKQGRDAAELKRVVDILADGAQLPPEYDEHKLSGNRKGLNSCHVAPDWILNYKIDHSRMRLVLSETGSHSYLYKK